MSGWEFIFFYWVLSFFALLFAVSGRLVPIGIAVGLSPLLLLMVWLVQAAFLFGSSQDRIPSWQILVLSIASATVLLVWDNMVGKPSEIVVMAALLVMFAALFTISWRLGRHLGHSTNAKILWTIAALYASICAPVIERRITKILSSGKPVTD